MRVSALDVLTIAIFMNLNASCDLTTTRADRGGFPENEEAHESACGRIGRVSSFWQMVQPYIVDGLRYLRVTQEGRQWVANLYANVFFTEHWGADRRRGARD
jgi:hypothetical protein